MLSLHSKMFPNPNEPSNTFEMHDITSFYPFSPASLHLNDGLQELFAPTTASLPPAADIVVKESSRAAQPRSDRRRSTRKDRHSKIFTAQGPRDRRMRLSLDVARKFFDLQDLLGFDKPSKTVQWLLTKSKSPIKELLAASKSELSSSPCEEDNSTVSSVLVNEKINAISKDKPFRSRRSLLQPKVGRESREKARARARERTLEKKMKQNTPNKRDNSQLDLKSSCLFAAEMDLKHCSASSMYGKQPHDYEGSNSMDMLDYNLQNVVSNTFHELWDQMSFTSNHIDERYFFS